jgi:septal ring factor EnvC (AmiA/AmiB activator)
LIRMAARDAVRAAILIKAVTPELAARARTFAAASEELKRVRRRADVQSGALFQAESAKADREAKIDDLIAEKQALEKQLYADADAAGADVQRLAARARSLGELVSTVDVRTPALRPADVAPLPTRFTPPVTGVLVHRFEAPGGAADEVKGVVFAASANATVLAPAAGMVEYAGPLKGWGEVLIVRAGNARLILAGLGQVGTEAGRLVAAGEPVGKMPGDTDRPTLYLEVRQASRPVDPARWLPQASAG